jgi:PAS domain S-box-containing protein
MVNPGTGGGLQLTAESFDALFPFHLGFGPDGILTRVGSSMRRLAPRTRPGQAVTEVLLPRRPDGPLEFATLVRAAGQLHTVREVTTGTVLRGQFQLVDGTLFFLGSPWLADMAELTRVNLALTDFAVHDPTLDLLQTLQVQAVATEDLRKLAGRLTEANEQMRLQQKEARKLALIAAHTDNAVILTDPEGRIEWVNAGFTRITGYDLAACAGRRPGPLLQGPATDRTTIAHMRACLARGEGFRAELINYHRDGHYYWIDIEVRPIVDESGQLVNFMAIESDVTARRLAEQNLRMQLGVARLLAGETAVGPASREVLAMIGREMGWVVGVVWLPPGAFEPLACAEIWHDPDVDAGDFVASKRLLRPAAEEGLVGQAWQTGRSVWLRDIAAEAFHAQAGTAQACGIHCAVAVPIKGGGQVLGVLEFFSPHVESQDGARLGTLTAVGAQLGQFIERVRAEAAVRAQSEELKRVNHELAEAARVKDAFLASLSHELRTPFTGILGMTETLLEPGMDPLSERQRQYLQVVEKSARQLLALINDMIDLARLEAGQQRLARRPCSVAEFCAAALQAIRPPVEERRQQVTLENTVPGARINADGRRVLQVLNNLLSNASKFTPPGGELGLQVRGGPGELVLTVWDKGIGIAAADQPRLFRPFVQLDGRLARKYEGTGLGLAIVRKLVELHGGRLSATSEVGHGSRFEVVLPWDGTVDPAS